MRKTIYNISHRMLAVALTAMMTVATAVMCVSCLSSGVKPNVTKTIDKYPAIFPDYVNVTIPKNIAPLNFSFLGGGECLLIVEDSDGERYIKGDDGLFSFDRDEWREMLESNKGGRLKLTVAVRKGDGFAAYKSFFLNIADDDIDPWLSYRLLPPGYQVWYSMGIYQRNLESYGQEAIYENKLSANNCVNCHSYCKGNPDKMLFHARAQFGGTVMITDGEPVKLNTKTDSTISALVYPYWHPSGRYVAFSVNKTNQNFFNHDKNRVEVYDSESDVVVYDVEKHAIAYSPLTRSAEAFETFPTFSPDGRSLYFCSADSVMPMPQRYKDVKYSLCRIAFNPSDMTFGNKVDTIVNAHKTGRSVSFPRISPDGRFLVFTMHAYGNFSIWHKDADLYAVNLSDNSIYALSAANSKDVDSYHSWSSNSRWLVFSSRRGDGLFTRPYITYIDKNGKAHKPFLLPQRNPLEYYNRLMLSYNIPELMTAKAKVSKYRIADALRNTKGIDVTVK